MSVRKWIVFLVLLGSTACGRVDVGTLPAPTNLSTATLTVPTSAATVTPLPTQQVDPTATLVIPSATVVPPTATLAQPAPPTATTVSGREQIVKIVLIALEDNGQSGPVVGCGDSAIPINVTIPQTQGVLRAALEKLLSAKQQFYGESGYYNALYQSDLQVQSVAIEGGKATIRLTGAVMLGGVCDAPRVQAQIEQTALQFSTVREVAVFVDDVPLEDVLSSK